MNNTELITELIDKLDDDIKQRVTVLILLLVVFSSLPLKSDLAPNMIQELVNQLKDSTK